MNGHPAPFGPIERPPPPGVLVGFRASEREREVLRKLASEAGMSVTALVRAALAERVQRMMGRA